MSEQEKPGLSKSAQNLGLIGMVVLSGFLGWLVSQTNNDSMMNHSGMHDASNTGSGNYTDSSIVFAYEMIEHHQQAIDMADLALTNSQNAEVKALASQIKAEQTPEVTQLQRWIDTAGGRGSAMSGSGHDMHGMMSDSDLEELRNTTGAAFDRLFLEGMIAHHEGALMMVHMIEGDSNAEVRKFAARVVTVQSAEIKQMKEMLAALGN